MVEPILIVVIIGAIGGIIRSYLGYEQQSDETETFDKKKMVKSVVRAALVGAFIVYGSTAITGTEINTGTYIMALFLSVGADVMTKEGAATVGTKIKGG